MPSPTPTIPPWIREFAHPGYVNVYSLDRLRDEPKLFCTETLLGDWDAETLLLAKDAAPVSVIRERVEKGERDPWRHGERGRDRMGFRTNERIMEIAGYFEGPKLYGSALAHLLKVHEATSSSLAGLSSGRLHEHLKRVVRFVVLNMPNLGLILTLGNDAHRLVASCVGSPTAAVMPVGRCEEVELCGRRVLVGRLYHPARPFSGGWAARRNEWQAVADQVSMRRRVIGRERGGSPPLVMK